MKNDGREASKPDQRNITNSAHSIESACSELVWSQSSASSGEEVLLKSDSSPTNTGADSETNSVQESLDPMSADAPRELTVMERWELALKQCNQDVVAAFTEMAILGFSNQEMHWLRQQLRIGEQSSDQACDFVDVNLLLQPSQNPNLTRPDESLGNIEHKDRANAVREQVALSSRTTEAPGYIIDTCLGSGGYGKVYSAWKQGDSLEEPAAYAIKFLHPNLVDDFRSKERFIREANVLALIDSRYVVRRICFDLNCNQPYIVFDRAVRGSLGDEIKRRKATGDFEDLFTASEIIAFAKDMLRGAIAAHEAGVIHRDIKPANLLISMDGSLQLTDFGMMATGEDSDLTHTDSALGTIGYAAPEQLEDAKLADAKSDQFAIGSTIYQLATGNLPYPCNSAASKLKRVRRSKPTLPSHAHSALTSDFDALVMRMLEPQPDQRFPDCRTALFALETYELGAQPSMLTRAANRWRSTKWTIRTRPALAGSVMAASVLIAGLIWYLVVQDAWAKQSLNVANQENAKLVARLVDVEAAARSRLAEERTASGRELISARMSSIPAGDFPRSLRDSRITRRTVCGNGNESSANLYASAMESFLSIPPVAVERNETRPRLLPTALAGSADGLIATATHSGAVYICSDSHPGYSETVAPGRIIHGQTELAFHGEEFDGQPRSERADHFYTSLCWDSSWSDYLASLKDPARFVAPALQLQIPLSTNCHPSGTLYAGTLRGVVRLWRIETGWKDVAKFENDTEGVEAISHLQWLDDSLVLASRTGKVLQVSGEKLRAAAAGADLVLLDHCEVVFQTPEEIADLVVRSFHPRTTDSVPSTIAPEWMGCIATRNGQLILFENSWKPDRTFELGVELFDLDIWIPNSAERSTEGKYTIAIGSAHPLPYLWRQSSSRPERLSNRYALNDTSSIEAVCFNAAGSELLALNNQSKYTRWDLTDMYSRERFALASTFLANKRTLDQPELGRRLPRSSFLAGYLLPHHDAWINYDMLKSVGWLQVFGVDKKLDSGFRAIESNDVAAIEFCKHEWLAIGGSDGRLQMIDVSTKNEWMLDFDGAIISVAALAGQLIVATENGNIARIEMQERVESNGQISYHAATSNVAKHPVRLIDVDVDQVRNRIVCLSADLQTTLYDLSGQQLFAANVFGEGVLPGTTTQAGAIAVSPDGQRIAIVCDQQMAAVFDLEKGQAMDVHFDLTGTRSLAAIWWNDHCLSYDSGNAGYGNAVLSETKDFSSHSQHGRCIEFTKLPACGLVWSNQRELSVVDLTTGRIVATFSIPISDEHAQICFSPSGKTVWIVGASGTVFKLELPIVDARTVAEPNSNVVEIVRGESVFCNQAKFDAQGAAHFIVANAIRSDQYAYTEMRLVKFANGVQVYSEVLNVEGLPNFAGQPLSDRKLDSASTKLYLDRDENPLVVTRVSRPDVDQSSFSTHLGRRRSSGQWDWIQVTDIENQGFSPVLVPAKSKMRNGQSNSRRLFNFDEPNFDIMHSDFWFQRACRTYFEDNQWKMKPHLEMGIQVIADNINEANWLVAGEYRGYSQSSGSVLRWDANSGEYHVNWLGPLGVCSVNLVESQSDHALVAVNYHDPRRQAELLKVTADEIQKVMELPYGTEMIAMNDDSLLCAEATTGTETRIFLHRFSKVNGWESQTIYSGPPSQQPTVKLVVGGETVGVVANLTTSATSCCLYIEPQLGQETFLKSREKNPSRR